MASSNISNTPLITSSNDENKNPNPKTNWCKDNLSTLIIVLIVSGVATIFLALFLAGSDSEGWMSESTPIPIPNQQEKNHPLNPLEKIKTITLSMFADKAASKPTSTSSPTIQALNRTIPFFEVYECPSKRKSSTSVKIETCTYNVASPKNVIRNWRYAKSSPRPQIPWFDLHKNGSLEIKRGLYQIYSKVTFKQIKNYNYSVGIVDTSGSAVGFSENNQIETREGNIVVESTMCANATQTQLLYLSIKKYALIYFFPEKTFFTITKLMNEYWRCNSVFLNLKIQKH